MKTPAVADLVWFHPYRSDSLWRKDDDQPRAAIVTWIDAVSGHVNLSVFGPNGFLVQRPSVRLVQVGETPPTDISWCQYPVVTP